IDHFGFRVRDLDASRRFYDAAMKAIGLQVVDNTQTSFIVGRSIEEPIPFVWIGTEEPKFWRGGHVTSNSPIHVAFKAPDEAAVRAFHAAAIEAGGTDNGGPG